MTNALDPVHIAVIGAGAFGRNHLRVYSELAQQNPAADHLAALVDPNPSIRAAAAARYNIPAFASLDDLLAAGLPIRAASVCVPTTQHAAVATRLLAANIDVLIEKPIASSLAEADAILNTAAQHGRIAAVGHLERFNPAVTAALDRLTRPMFFEAHRLSIFTPRSLDVDVVLDLMIHDLDIVLTLANSTVRELRATGIPVISAKADIANVRVEFVSGAVANFTASRVSTEQVRKLRLFQPHQYLSLDFARQELLTISVDPNIIAAGAPSPASGTWVAAEAPGALAHPTTGFHLEKLDLPRAEPLRLELEDFLQSIHTRTQPRVPAAAGRAALALALEINAAIASHQNRAGL